MIEVPEKIFLPLCIFSKKRALKAVFIALLKHLVSSLRNISSCTEDILKF